MKLRNVLCFVLLFYLFAVPGTAYGYLDPATGSVLLQFAVGGFLALLAAVRIYWKKLRSLFVRLLPRSDRDA